MHDSEKEVKIAFPAAICVKITPCTNDDPNMNRLFTIINNTHDLTILGYGDTPQGAWDNAWKRIYARPKDDRETS